jgi:ABC-2 type transport system ATP-binding protein
VFAFLGPNGAGKTTTVEILEGYRRRDAGEVSVLGVDPARAGGDWRARIGVVLQESEPEAELTVEECLALYAGYYPAPRPVGQTLELVGLAGQRAKRCGRMSGGQRRRLDMALALIGDPELIFLDEPTTGFDPAARQSAWDVIAGLRDLGKTAFLTTHYMEEAEHLADRIAVLAAGRIVAQGKAATLGGRDDQASVISFTLPPGVPAAELPPPVAACVTRSVGSRVEAAGHRLGRLRGHHPQPHRARRRPGCHRRRGRVLLSRLRGGQPHQQHRRGPARGPGHRAAAELHLRRLHRHLRAAGLAGIGKVFPVERLAAALLAAYNPYTTGSGMRWGDLAVVAAWGAAGLIIAIRRFRWLPRGG